MIDKYKNLIVNIASCVMAPFMMLYALYALFHGHSSPGGGFQGGSIMAAGVMLLRLSLGRERSSRKFPVWMAPILGTIGVMIYAGTGIFAMLGGGNYLDYGYMPLPFLSTEEHRYWGILFIEIGVFLGVSGIMVTIFDCLTAGDSDD